MKIMSPGEPAAPPNSSNMAERPAHSIAARKPVCELDFPPSRPNPERTIFQTEDGTLFNVLNDSVTLSQTLKQIIENRKQTLEDSLTCAARLDNIQADVFESVLRFCYFHTSRVALVKSKKERYEWDRRFVDNIHPCQLCALAAASFHLRLQPLANLTSQALGSNFSGETAALICSQFPHGGRAPSAPPSHPSHSTPSVSLRNATECATRRKRKRRKHNKTDPTPTTQSNSHRTSSSSRSRKTSTSPPPPPPLSPSCDCHPIQGTKPADSESQSSSSVQFVSLTPSSSKRVDAANPSSLPAPSDSGSSEESGNPGVDRNDHYLHIPPPESRPSSESCGVGYEVIGPVRRRLRRLRRMGPLDRTSVYNSKRADSTSTGIKNPGTSTSPKCLRAQAVRPDRNEKDKRSIKLRLRIRLPKQNEEEDHAVQTARTTSGGTKSREQGVEKLPRSTSAKRKLIEDHQSRIRRLMSHSQEADRQIADLCLRRGQYQNELHFRRTEVSRLQAL